MWYSKLFLFITQERVKGLEAEIARLKPLVAANAGHADLAAFLARERSGEASYVEDLQKRLQYVSISV